jgi:Zn-dependent protease
MAEIEDDIRRRLIAERQQQLEAEQRRALEYANGAAACQEADQAVLSRPAAGASDALGNGWASGTQATTQQQDSQPQQRPYYAAPPQVLVPHKAGTLHRWKAKGGVLGAIASMLLFLLKLGAPIIAVFGKLAFLGKFLLTAGSMLLSMWVYATRFGWPFGIGIVALIFIHECGHAWASHRCGFKYGFMLFVPMMGAFVTRKGYGQSIVTDAFIGIMGPVVGTMACVVCGLIYIPTHNQFWLGLASWGMFINLFNLLPTPPLDGGWITPLFSPKLLAIGAVIAFLVGFKNPLIWLLLLASLPRIIGGWKADPKTQPYYQVPVYEKWKYGMIYLGLAGFLAVGGFILNGIVGM